MVKNQGAKAFFLFQKKEGCVILMEGKRKQNGQNVILHKL